MLLASIGSSIFIEFQFNNRTLYVKGNFFHHYFTDDYHDATIRLRQAAKRQSRNSPLNFISVMYERYKNICR